MTTLPASALQSNAPADLLLRIGEGSAEAFGMLYDQLAPLVHRVSTELLADLEQAEQATEDVFVEVWRGARRFEPERQDALDWVLATTYLAVVKRRRAPLPGQRA